MDTPAEMAARWTQVEMRTARLIVPIVDKEKGDLDARSFPIAKILVAQRAAVWRAMAVALEDAATGYDAEAMLCPVATRKLEFKGASQASRDHARSLRQQATALLLGIGLEGAAMEAAKGVS